MIEAILTGRDALGIMPTGAGKSVCYQIPAMLLPGITLVISPLISLMKDQVRSLCESGVKAAYLNSSLSAAQQSTVLSRARAGQYKIIYVAPERLDAEGFREFACEVGVSLIAVDEAHCVSQWGQDFRPHYLHIAEFCDLLPNRPVRCAFTATATGRVREDIIRLLGLNSPTVTLTGFDRPNLYFNVLRPDGGKYDALVRLLKGNRERTGIIYCSTRKTVEELCDKLCEDGWPATRYHAGLDSDERMANQEAFIYDRSTVMVATNAFGMGIDKSNVSFVIHYNIPKSIEAYYQEAGRAGRDGEPADCTVLYSGQDVRTNLFLIDKNENEELDEQTLERVRQQDRERLMAMVRYCTGTGCLRKYLLEYFGDKAGSCGNCGNCNSSVAETDITLEAQKIISCVCRMAQATGGLSFGRTMLADVLRGSDDPRVTERGFEKLSTYGIMSDIPAARIYAMADYLADNGYLTQNSGEYRTLKPGPRYAEIVRDKKPISMKLPTEKKTRAERRLSSPPPESTEKKLLDALRDVRSGIAAREHTPAYIIFTNASLQAMCRDLPTTAEAFANVAGVGEYRAKKYWHEFAPVIAEHIERQKKAREKAEREPKPVDRSLYDKLRELRSELAEEEKVPPYCIFNNATLLDMCEKLPATREEFLEVNGVGRRKADKYWNEISAVIAKHLGRE